jgi:hypothetical protein
LFLQNVVDHNGKLRQHPAYRLVKIVRQEATHARSEPEREGTFSINILVQVWNMSQTLLTAKMVYSKPLLWFTYDE